MDPALWGAIERANLAYRQKFSKLRSLRNALDRMPTARTFEKFPPQPPRSPKTLRCNSKLWGANARASACPSTHTLILSHTLSLSHVLSLSCAFALSLTHSPPPPRSPNTLRCNRARELARLRSWDNTRRVAGVMCRQHTLGSACTPLRTPTLPAVGFPQKSGTYTYTYIFLCWDIHIHMYSWFIYIQIYIYVVYIHIFMYTFCTRGSTSIPFYVPMIHTVGKSSTYTYL